MKLRILWLYHDIKDVFGDAGNIQVLKKRCQLRNIDCQVTTCGIDEDQDMSAYDLIYFGTNITGTDSYVLQDLMKKKTALLQAKEKGVFFMLVCGGFQAFGKEYIYPDETIPALHMFSYRSDYRTKANCIGNASISSAVAADSIIGFENHAYQMINIVSPLGKVSLGKGNDLHSMQEGYVEDRVIGTNLHGPLLPKNPQLADYIIQQAVSPQNSQLRLEPLPDLYETKAREAIIKRFMGNE